MTRPQPTWRSLLFVPVTSERFVAKAHTRGADAIILDLEDAVAPQEKARARAALKDAVPAVGRNGATVFVRINAVATGLAFDDADAACRAGAFGLFVAKVQAPSQNDRHRGKRDLMYFEAMMRVLDRQMPGYAD